MLLGIVTVFLLCVRSSKKYNIFYYDFLIIGGFAVLFALPSGSLLYAIVTYGFKAVVTNILAGNFDVFGGLVFYGALIGGIIGALLGIRVAKQDLGVVERIVIPYIPIGHAIGRVGCLLAGCCYGMEYTGSLAVYYPHSLAGALPEQGYFPVQILEAILNLGVCLILVNIRKVTKHKFELLSVYFILYGIVRFIVEFFRGDLLRGIFYSFSTSQWISLALSLGGILYILAVRMIAKTKHKKI